MDSYTQKMTISVSCEVIKILLEPHISKVNPLICLNNEKNYDRVWFQFLIETHFLKVKNSPHISRKKKSPPRGNRTSSGVVKIFVVLFSLKISYLDSCLSCEKSSRVNFAFFAKFLNRLCEDLEYRITLLGVSTS